jgi:hypothetical protein
MKATRLLAIALVGGLAVGAGCRRGGGPGGALDQYGAALHRRDFGAAYDLMSSAFRGKVSRDDYVRMMKDNGREVDETAERLEGRRGDLEVSAEFTYGVGDQLRLVQEDGRWRIATNPLAFYDQASPQAALRSFVRAYRLERWDVMLRFVPKSYREKMDAAKVKAQFQGPSHEQMESLMNALESNVGEPIKVLGTEARMSYGDHSEVKFVLEDGSWRLKDLD